MSTDPGDRTRHWPAIEKKYGRDMAFWFDAMRAIDGQGYTEQMAFLQKEHGFTRSHANALVMFTRGSGSSKRFAALDDYLAGVDPIGATTVRGILAAIQRDHPGLELVISWNQPMLKAGGNYVFAVSAQKTHVLIAPWSAAALEEFRPRFEAAGYTVNKKTIRVPIGWDIDHVLLRDMVGAVLEELDEG